MPSPSSFSPVLWLLVGLGPLSACRGEVHEGPFEVRGPLELEDLGHYVRVEGSIVFAPGLGLEVIELPKLESAGGLVIERDATLRSLRLPALVEIGKLELGDPEWPRVSLPRLESVELTRLARVETLRVAHAPLLQNLELGALSEAEHHFSIEADSLVSLELPALSRAPYLSMTGKKLSAFNAPRLNSGARVRIESEDPVALEVPAEVEVTVVERGRLARESARSERLSMTSAASGELLQLGVGQDPEDRPLVVMGYLRKGHAIFVAREGQGGAERWSTTVPWPAPWSPDERDIPGLPAAVGKVVLVQIVGGNQRGRVVALDPKDGHILWRREGNRATILGEVALVQTALESRTEMMTVDLGTGEVIEKLDMTGSSLGRHPPAVEPFVIGERIGLRTGLAPVQVALLDGGRVVERLRFFKGMPAFVDGEWVVGCSTYLAEPSGFEVNGKTFPCPHATERPTGSIGKQNDERSGFVTADDLAERDYLAASDGRSPLRRVPRDRAPRVVSPLDGPQFELGPYRVEMSRAPSGENPSHLPEWQFGSFGTLQVKEASGRVTFELDASSLGLGPFWDVHEVPLGARPADAKGIRLGVLVDLGERGVAMAWLAAPRLIEQPPEIASAYVLRWGDENLAETFARAPGAEGRDFQVRSLFRDGLHIVATRGGAIIDVHTRRLVWANNPDVELVDVTDEVRALWKKGPEQAP